jgi:hypothetical protein
LIGGLCHRRVDDQRVQLKDIRQREIHRLELAGLTLNHRPLLPWSVRVVIGEDLQRLAMLGHQTLPNVYPSAHPEQPVRLHVQQISR